MRNSIEIIGVITSEPSVFEDRVNFTLAGTTPENPQTGASRTFYHQVTMFGTQAAALGAHLEVGQGVAVEGRLNYREFEKDGVKRNSLDIIANPAGVRFLDPSSFEVAVDAKGQPRLIGARNRVSLQGNLVAAPELRYTTNGKAVCDARIAINDSYRNNQGEQVKRTHYLDITAWEGDAERLAEASKGSGVQVAGFFDEESWTDKNDNKRYSKKVTASELYLFARNLASVSGTAASATSAVMTGDAPAEDLPF